MLVLQRAARDNEARGGRATCQARRAFSHESELRRIGRGRRVAAVGEIETAPLWTTLAPRLWVYLFAHLAGNFVCSQACARVVASSSVLLNLVLTTMRFAAIVLSATLLAKADAPRAGAALWGGAVLVSAGVIAFATSPPAIKERRKAHVSDPIPEEEA